MSKDIDTILTEKGQLYFYKALWQGVIKAFRENKDELSQIVYRHLMGFENELLKKLEDLEYIKLK